MSFYFHQDSLSLQSTMSTTFTFLFFSFTLLFSFFSFLLFISRIKPWCNCNTCKTFLTMSWSNKFVNLVDYYTHLLQESPTGTIHVHVLGNTITSNPENVEYILKTNFNNYPKGKQFSTILGDLLGRGIFNVDGHSWKFQRKMASLELGSVVIRSYAMELVIEEIKTRLLPLIASVAEKKTASKADNTSEDVLLDMQDILRRFSFDNICKFSFGLDPCCLVPSLPVSNLANAFDLSSTLSAQRALTASPLIWKMKRFFNIGSEKKLKEAIKIVNDLANEMIKQRREIENGVESRKDLLSRFMGALNSHDDEYLRDIVVSFLLAGRDTVASALTGFFILLSKNPKVEEKIRVELDRVMNPNQECATFEQTREMHYLNGAIHESMRLFPPVQFDSKFALEDDVLPDGTFIKKGSRVTYHPYAMGRMENIWGPDCLEFKPERWLKDGVFVPKCPFKYPVFQAGSRVCLGKELAIVEMKSVVASLVKRFDVRVVGPNQEPQFAPGLTASFRGGLPVKIYERT
ncbi:cytochrome P450 family 94 protein [Medicago truncatula]|uniref:Cytochrome P450 family 94 protein n=2 Tax=Medicago truncatula TaxID=3880 RepID=Q2MJ03_MEDTR|nr:cytochrome P450 monooxygenase CYP94C9 [Medicago truncatula]AES88420.1 cytochrome P450 family 94 protein [Medicago truncatula]